MDVSQGIYGFVFYRMVTNLNDFKTQIHNIFMNYIVGFIS